MFRPTLIFGLVTLIAASSVYAQTSRTSATSSSAVNSSRTTSSSSSRTSGTGGTTSMGDFQPIERGGFVGRSQDSGFVGRSSSGTSTGMSGMGRSGMGMGMGMGGLGGMGFGGMNSRGMNSQFGQQSNSQNQKNTIRATVKVRFPYERPAATQVSRTVMSRWNRIPLPEKFKGVSLNFENGVATLSGKVATPEEKRMAEKLILLEPGVSSVQNQLEVVATENSN